MCAECPHEGLLVQSGMLPVDFGHDETVHTPREALGHAHTFKFLSVTSMLYGAPRSMIRKKVYGEDCYIIVLRR